ncbi:MAG: serine/threonine protein kinase [Proteobacteria bacterium]|nr:serine/threonine protein kinase [Pseudomonadota bacterium]
MIEPTAPPMADPWIGRVIDSRYRVIERIGRGGMGSVYKVEHVRMGKIAALKLLHPELGQEPTLAARFRQEAEAISRLNHPNIVQVFDFSQVGDTLYLVMEYLAGENLGVLLRRQGAWPMSRCVRVLAQVCDALSEAHATGIIHRDLKPENIQVARTQSGQDLVKVVDFGLSKMIDREQPEAMETRRGTLVGTPHYMSPEQIRGLPIDVRCDIYSLGAVTYRMLTGQHVFSAPTPVAVLTKHMSEPVVPPSRVAPEGAVPAAVDAVVLCALAKEREERYPSAQLFKEALLGAANRSLAEAVATSPTLRPPSGTTPAATGPALPERRGADQVDDIPLLPGRTLGTDPEAARFTRGLRRGRVLRGGLLLAALGALGGAFYWYAIRRPNTLAPTREREPNDMPAEATLLRPGQPVSGLLGKRLSDAESDRDWYRLVVAGAAAQQLTAQVSALPNMDLALELYDGRGQRQAAADAAGAGLGEMIPAWPVTTGSYYLLVREVWRVGRSPTENVTDQYRLEVALAMQPANWELEPNDAEGNANPLAIGATVDGLLGSAADEDTYRVDVPHPRLVGEVSAVAGVDLVVEIWRQGSTKRKLIDAHGSGASEAISGIRAHLARPIFIRVRRKDQRKSLEQAPASLDAPYRLRVWPKGTAAPTRARPDTRS